MVERGRWALPVLHTVNFVLCILITVRMLRERRFRALPNALYPVLLCALALWSGVCAFMLFAGYNRRHFTQMNSMFTWQPTVLCTTQSFLLTLLGNVCCFIHSIVVVELASVCRNQPLLSQTGTIRWTALLLVPAFVWAIIVLFLGKHVTYASLCHLAGPNWVVIVQSTFVLLCGAFICGKCLQILKVLTTAIMGVPRHLSQQRRRKTLLHRDETKSLLGRGAGASSPSFFRHPKFDTDPNRTILPPLRRNLIFVVLSLCVWCVLVAGAVLAVADADTPVELSPSSGIPKHISLFELAAFACPLMLLISYFVLFRASILGRHDGEEVWVARAQDFDSKRFKNNMDVVGACSSDSPGLARVGSGFWRPSHMFILSPKLAAASQGSSNAVGTGGDLMSPARKWLREQDRRERARENGAALSDSYDREAVLPSQPGGVIVLDSIRSPVAATARVSVTRGRERDKPEDNTAKPNATRSVVGHAASFRHTGRSVRVAPAPLHQIFTPPAASKMNGARQAAELTRLGDSGQRGGELLAARTAGGDSRESSRAGAPMWVDSAPTTMVPHYITTDVHGGAGGGSGNSAPSQPRHHYVSLTPSNLRSRSPALHVGGAARASRRGGSTDGTAPSSPLARHVMLSQLIEVPVMELGAAAGGAGGENEAGKHDEVSASDDDAEDDAAVLSTPPDRDAGDALTHTSLDNHIPSFVVAHNIAAVAAATEQGATTSRQRSGGISGTVALHQQPPPSEETRSGDSPTSRSPRHSRQRRPVITQLVPRLTNDERMPMSDDPVAAMFRV